MMDVRGAISISGVRCCVCLVLYVSLVVEVGDVWYMPLHRDACYVFRTLHARISVHYGCTFYSQVW
jgi:hypothetical protein